MSGENSLVLILYDAYSEFGYVLRESCVLGVADTAGDVRLVLSGAVESAPWQVKFTIRDRHLRERVFLSGGPSEVTCYALPPGVPAPPLSTLNTISTFINLIGPQSIQKTEMDSLRLATAVAPISALVPLRLPAAPELRGFEFEGRWYYMPTINFDATPSSATAGQVVSLVLSVAKEGFLQGTGATIRMMS